MNILNLVLFSTSLVLILVLLYLVVKSNINKRKLLALYIQSEMHKHMLGQKIEELQRELSSKELSETDGFVKFISQSRDWAFEYIEEVQKALAEFDESRDDCRRDLHACCWHSPPGPPVDSGLSTT
jgi:hypothetical protein